MKSSRTKQNKIEVKSEIKPHPVSTPKVNEPKEQTPEVVNIVHHGVSPQKSILTDTILLTCATAYMYLVTFMYEYGYCSNFNIPKHLSRQVLQTFLCVL